MTFHYEIFWIVVSFLLTVMVLSYLLGDNVFFRFAAHLFIGLTAAYVVLLIFNELLWPYLINPLITGTWIERLWLVIPVVIIILLFLSQLDRFKWFGRIPLAYLAGMGAAITVGGAVFGTMIPQTRAIINAFDPTVWYMDTGQVWQRIADAIIMLVGTVGTLSYFHFGRKWKIKADEDETKRPLALEVLSRVGQVFYGITLGAVFAGVFSSAMLALIDRILFIGDFISNLLRIF